MFSRCKRENVGDESDEESLHKNPMENTNVEDDAGHSELSCKAGRRQVVRSGQSRAVWSESCGQQSNCKGQVSGLRLMTLQLSQ
jgi:hypothetical protein